MLAQLKTVVLLKEEIKLAFFRLVEYLEHQHLWVRLLAQNGQKLSSEIHQSVLVLRNEGHCVLLPSQNSTNWLERTVGGPGAQLSKRTSTLVSSLRNRPLTSPQLAASSNSTRKTLVSTSKVKRWLGMLAFFFAWLQRKSHISDGPIKLKIKMGKRTQTLDRQI